MVSKHPRKQRRFLYNAPLHTRRKFLSAHLAEELLVKYDRRSFPVAKGDTVKIMRGEFKGHVDKVAAVNLKKGRVEIEGITLTKADGKKVPKLIHPSDLMITKLNLTDPVRRARLERGVSEEVKKEIEKEAEEQIREMEEQKLEEEQKKKEEKEEEAEKEVEETEEPQTEEDKEKQEKEEKNE